MNEIDYCPYHIWGDDWKYWDTLYEAESFIFNYVYKYSRCRVLTKEKYGTLRYEWILPPGRSLDVSSVKLPYVSYDKDQKRYYLGKCIVWRWVDSRMYSIWRRYGKWMLNRAVNKACKKWPEIKAELLSDYDPEYL